MRRSNNDGLMWEEKIQELSDKYKDIIDLDQNVLGSGLYSCY